ncbi:hypothetical protein APHAL10511_004220 [Amanita phalloides]|nr:hypothetical protein APHAL10511_004220 [Amanita phalloides]
MDFENYRNLIHVDEDEKKLNIILVVHDLQRVTTRLETFNLKMEIYLTSNSFLRFRRLKIVYDEDFPTEYAILSLGAQFLHEFKHLHAFQLYNPLYHSPPFTACRLDDDKPSASVRSPPIHQVFSSGFTSAAVARANTLRKLKIVYEEDFPMRSIASCAKLDCGAQFFHDIPALQPIL